MCHIENVWRLTWYENNHSTVNNERRSKQEPNFLKIQFKILENKTFANNVILACRERDVILSDVQIILLSITNKE